MLRLVLLLLLGAASAEATNNPCGVALVKQLSHGACTFGTTFGCLDPNHLYVRNCSGDFRCGVASPTLVTCRSTDFKENSCGCAGPGPGPAPPAPTPPPGPVIGGSGDFKYLYRRDLLKLPDGAEVQHAHGLETDDAGYIYMTYVNWNNGIATNGTDQHCLVRWNPDGTNGTFMDLGGTDLCKGTPHGLTLAKEGGELFLYHANCGVARPRYGSGKLTKTTLTGKILWQHVANFGQDPKALYRPTWWAIPPSGPFVYLADGYGSSNVYVFTRDGVFQNHTFGGKGTEDGKFNNCHGMHYDPRTGQLVVADRENHRVQFFDFDETGTKFAHASTLALTYGQNGTQRPCNLRVLENAVNASLDGMAVIADLGANDQSKPGPGVAMGQVAVLDSSNTLVSVIKISELLGSEGSVHPHDSHFLANGDIVVATWDPGRITYWKLL